MSAFVARALVFISSAAVLVMEILAGRLMAPYVGVSLETFTGIIIGSVPLNAFDDFVADWKRLGGDQWTEEVNEWAAKR